MSAILRHHYELIRSRVDAMSISLNRFQKRCFRYSGASSGELSELDQPTFPFIRPAHAIPRWILVTMSKRTLDAFLVAPASNAKKAKRIPNAGSLSSSHNNTKRDAVQPGVVEVIDLDEVIDLSSPPLQPQDVLYGDATASTPKPNVDESTKGGDAKEEEDRILARATDSATTQLSKEIHQNYPIPIPRLSLTLSHAISASPVKEPKILNHLPHLDLLTFEPYLGPKDSREYGEFLRRELPFYRVEYKLTRFGKETDIKTPRFTVSMSL
jgi:hypothetical protein